MSGFQPTLDFEAAKTAAEDGAEFGKPARKEGWAKAKPKFEHKKTFKPRARPGEDEGTEGGDRPRRPFTPREPRADQFIDDRRAPRDGAKGGFGDRPKRDFKPREGGFGDRPQRDFQPRDGAPRSGGDRPQRDFKPREGGFGDRPQRDFKPRSGGKPGGFGGFGGKPGGGSRPGGGKPFGGKPSGGRGGPRG